MKTFTTKQVFILVFCVVLGIAFMETSAPVSAAYVKKVKQKLLQTLTK